MPNANFVVVYTYYKRGKTSSVILNRVEGKYGEENMLFEKSYFNLPLFSAIVFI